MKNVLFVFLVIFFVGSFVGCKKEKDENKESSHESGMSKEDINVMNGIVSFRGKVKHKRDNPSLKSTEILSIDSALWDIATNFNASYSFPDLQYSRINVDSSTLFINMMDSSSVSLEDVFVLNDLVYNQVVLNYNQYCNPSHELISIVLREGEMAKGGLEVKLAIISGEKNPSLYTFTPFKIGDDWKYGDFLGKCDGSLFGSSDAARQIQDTINKYRTSYCDDMPGPSYLYRRVYTDDPLSPYKPAATEYTNAAGEYLIFYLSKSISFTADEMCLDFNEMNFHYNGEWEVIYDRLRLQYDKPCNWDFMYCDISGDFYSDSFSSGPFVIKHNNTLTYHYHHYVKRDVIGDPISLNTFSD